MSRTAEAEAASAVKVAVLGAGQWGQNLVKTFAQLGALAAVVDPSPEIRKKVHADFPTVHVLESCEELLQLQAKEPEAQDIRAVVIATPAPTHFALAREFLLAGMDVFLEKPMTLTVEDAVEVNRIAREQEAVLMVGHLLLYQPAIQFIKSFLERGELGPLQSLHQKRLKLGRVRQNEDVLWSFGAHDLAVLHHLVGNSPQTITASGQCVLQPEAAIADDVHVHLGFAGGVHAHLHVSWLWPVQERRLMVAGTRGMLEYDEQTQTVTWHRKGVREDLSTWEEASEVVFQGDTAPLRLECQHFLDCVQHRQTPLSDGESAEQVVRVLQQAAQRMKEGVVR
ncbi:Gfo/Idh/MocA family protein [Tumebacillus flagellatus]|uniref:Oxidoreductase n=1 Tax=Tumebacillus flagellatus TaxID=1157490 RepID=A0A074LMB4_9BACL|nr:Gfo/Idh/MocA family oxidoreductase [Tumebacillus flagellatus]KEO81023.1 hypothetical protein EL26_23065 [Tumebacillus flagellatus]